MRQVPGSRLTRKRNLYLLYDRDYDHIGTCKAHNSFITALDWSADSSQVHPLQLRRL